MARTTSPTIGAGISGATAGSVFFAGTGGVLQQDNSSIFFDNTNNRLGLMTAAPTHTLTFGSTGTGIAIYNTADQTTNYERVRIQWASNRLDITSGAGGSGSSRNIRIGINSGPVDTSGGASYIDLGSAVITYTTRGGSATSGHSFTIGNNTMSSSTQVMSFLTATVTHTGTAGYTAMGCNITEASTGSGAKNLLLLQTGGVTKFGVDNTGSFSCSNTVAVGAAVASTHKVTVVIGGTTYYLLASNI